MHTSLKIDAVPERNRLSYQAAADRLGVHVETVRQFVKRGLLEAEPEMVERHRGPRPSTVAEEDVDHLKTARNVSADERYATAKGTYIHYLAAMRELEVSRQTLADWETKGPACMSGKALKAIDRPHRLG